MSTLLHDLRFSLRLLAKSRGFTAAAIAVLALGIGVNTAIFSVARDLLFSPRPFPHPEQVLQLYTQDKKEPKRFRQFSYSTYVELRDQNTVFSDVLAHNMTMIGIGEGEVSRRTFAAIVSSNYFSTLQVPLARGRTFLPEEERPGAAAPVVIASHVYWRKTGYDPALVGKTIRVNERLFTVVGIAPEHFTGTMMLFGPELYFPLSNYDALTNSFNSDSKRSLERRDAHELFLVGRLKPGVSPETADAALKSLGSAFETAYPVEHRDQTFIARALPRLSTSSAPADESDLGMFGTLLIGMAGLVLLIACLNLANMLLARGAARRKEISIRLALGGGRGRIVRQLLTEGLVLSIAGGLFGLLLASWVTALLGESLAARMPLAMSLRGATDPSVFGVTLGFCAFATLGFALGPALKLARTDVLTDLKGNAGEDSAPPRARWMPRNPLVVAQVALSLGLLTAAGLFIRGAREAGNVETGFKADDTILIEVDASLGGYDRTRSLQLYQAANNRLASLPGVQSASIGAIAPFGFITINRPVQRAGVIAAPDTKPATAAEGL
ncbi:MAG: ABC transporter permease, partial [Opitutus sp.]